MNTLLQMPPLSFGDTKLPMANEFASLAIQKNTNELLCALARFDFKQFNQAPAAGGWAPGAIAEHLLLVEIQIARILKGNPGQKRKAPLDPEEKVALIIQRMSDRTERIEAPESLLPSDTSKDPTSFAEKMLTERRSLIQLVCETNLFCEYPDNPHRFYGVMTGIEWVNFILHHCLRHIEQLNELRFR